jgi:hypothetical protein
MWRAASLFMPAVLSLSTPGEDPKLVLDAPRVQTILPGLASKGFGKRVDVTARLTGDPETPKDFYCLDEVWEWGDGTESFHEQDCEPYAALSAEERNLALRKEFQDEHYYRPGQYTIRLRLTRGEKTVIRGTIDVRIY